MQQEPEFNGLDYGLDTVSKVITQIYDQTGKIYYVLFISDSRKLINGFRYIKELLLQHHNMKMYLAHKLLVENNIRVYSVKTDAFAIEQDDERAVKIL